MTGGKETGALLLEVLVLDVVPRGNDAALVDAPEEFDDDLAAAVVVDLCEGADVA